MKIAFWINNSGFRHLDCSEILKGNPGIGGSEFSALLIAGSLSMRGIETLILCNAKGKFSSKQKYYVCADLASACRYVKNNKFDFFVIDSRSISESILLAFPSIRFIAWANCFIDDWMNIVFPKYPNLVKFVNVGKEQCRLCNNMPIASKSTYIFNAVPTEILNEIAIIPFEKRNNNVVYIGSLHKAKGFHLLAKGWAKVLESVPDAELYVIGSGKLYSRKCKLGKWNIANEEYEAYFMKYLEDNGTILPSVHFLGIMGKEKYQILNQCKVGVPNPSGVSETFGFTAVEMQMMGCKVTTILCPGYEDTVYDKEDLYNNPDNLPEYIIKLLRQKRNEADIYKFIERFSVDNITNQWVNLFESLLNVSIHKFNKTSWAYIYNNILLYLKTLKHIIRKS